MRFTKTLYQINYLRHFERMWKRQGKMEIKSLEIPPELQAMGIEIKEGKEILDETKLFKPPPVTKAIGLPYPLPPSAFTLEAPYYKMHADTKVTEGENQIMALTKTVPYEGLPEKIQLLIGLESLPNQDELVQTSILQALVWDAMQDRLPRKTLPGHPLYVCKRPFGICNEKKVSSLLEKLSCLCDSATGKYSESFQRNKLLNAFCEMGIKRNGSNVAFQMHSDILLKAKKPLTRFASPAEVKATEKLTIPNIYPLKPTLDLDKCEENPVQNYEIQYTTSFGRIHTLFMAQKSQDKWLPNEQLAKAIGMCFAFTAAEARLIYGEDVRILPEPVSIQCMYLDTQSANFLAYQLNTLELDDNEGIKNQIWIDGAANFYSDISEVDLISDYNSSIFPKMLAFHINGLSSK